MAIRTKQQLFEDLVALIRSGGQGGLTTAGQVRQFCVNLIDTLFHLFASVLPAQDTGTLGKVLRSNGTVGTTSWVSLPAGTTTRHEGFFGTGPTQPLRLDATGPDQDGRYTKTFTLDLGTPLPGTDLLVFTNLGLLEVQEANGQNYTVTYGEEVTQLSFFYFTSLDVSGTPDSASGPATWGLIQGTLADQADLNQALQLLNTSLANKSAIGHGHEIAEVNGLQGWINNFTLSLAEKLGFADVEAGSNVQLEVVNGKLRISATGGGSLSNAYGTSTTGGYTQQYVNSVALKETQIIYVESAGNIQGVDFSAIRTLEIFLYGDRSVMLTSLLAGADIKKGKPLTVILYRQVVTASFSVDLNYFSQQVSQNPDNDSAGLYLPDVYEFVAVADGHFQLTNWNMHGGQDSAPSTELATTAEEQAGVITTKASTPGGRTSWWAKVLDGTIASYFATKVSALKLELGNAAAAGATRVIEALGSAADVGLSLKVKGAARARLEGAQYTLSESRVLELNTAGELVATHPTTSFLFAAGLGNVVYVSPNGNDSTGLRGRIDRPFLTGTAASNAANGGDVIHFMPGTYSGNVVVDNRAYGFPWPYNFIYVLDNCTISGSFTSNYNDTAYSIIGFGRSTITGSVSSPNTDRLTRIENVTINGNLNPKHLGIATRVTIKGQIPINVATFEDCIIDKPGASLYTGNYQLQAVHRYIRCTVNVLYIGDRLSIHNGCALYFENCKVKCHGAGLPVHRWNRTNLVFGAVNTIFEADKHFYETEGGYNVVESHYLHNCLFKSRTGSSFFANTPPNAGTVIEIINTVGNVPLNLTPTVQANFVQTPFTTF